MKSKNKFYSYKINCTKMWIIVMWV